MRRFSLASLAALSTLALMSPARAAAQEVQDANCLGPKDSGLGVVSPGNTQIAQTFTALHTGKLTRAQISVHKAAGSTGDYVLSIHAVDAAGVPTVTVLATMAIPNDAVPEGDQMIEGVFATPADVVAGQQYALVLSRPGGSQLGVNSRFPDPCPGGSYVREGTGDWTVFSPPDDIIFAVFVTLSPTTRATCKGKPATHVGTAGDNLIIGTNGPDVIAALDGNDKVLALDGNDIVCGGRGKDRLLGQGGEDILKGNRGKDTEKGGADDDRLKGNSGADLLKGKTGEDFLGGGKGRDTCIGGTGEDSGRSCATEKSV